jgi:hypothetical protein
VLLMFEAIRRKIEQWRNPAPTIVQRVAPKAQAMIRESSRTPRGNIPWFAGPPKGSTNIPTTVTAVGNEFKIQMVDWALAKENAKGLPDKMAALVRAEVQAMKEGR